MANPIKSPTSARPSALPSKVPEADKMSAEDQALLDAAANFSPEEQKLLDAASSFQPQQQQQQGMWQQMMASPSRTFWTGQPTTGAEAFQQGLGQTAELIGSAPVIAGTAIGSVAGPAGALAGSMAGALVQKDVTNLVRKAFGLSANEDRSRLLDVAFSSLSAVPGLGGQAAMRNVMAGGNASADLVFGGASAEAQAAYQSMKAAVLEQMQKNGLSPEQAAEKVAGITSNLQKYVGDYSEFGVLKGLSEAFANKIQVQNKVNDLAMSLSPETITQESMVKGGIVNRPEKLLEAKSRMLNNRWKTAFEQLKVTKGIDKVDTNSYLEKLKGIRASVSVDPEARQLIDNVIENVSSYQSAVNETRDLGIFARGAGGEPPKYYDVSTGQQLVQPSESATQGVLTKEQKAASLLPSKIVENYNISMMEGIDALISKRQRIDKLAKSFPDDSDKGRLYQSAADALRDVENEFIDALYNQGGPNRHIADAYRMAKRGIYDLKTKVEDIGSAAKKEAYEFADALDSMPVEKTKSFSAVMPLEVRQKVLRRYWDNLVNPIFNGFEGTLKEVQANKIQALNTPERAAKFEVLSAGMQPGKFDLASATDELYKLTMQASKLDPGKMVRSPLFPKLIRAGARLIGQGAPVEMAVQLASNGNEQAAKIALDRFMQMNFDDIVASADRSNASRLVSWMKSTAGSDNPNVQRFIDTLAQAGLAASQIRSPLRTQITGQSVRALNQ